jgi:uncharacterized protein YgbK (DUF1537 family)
MGDLQIPLWLNDLSLPGAIILFGLALARGWLLTSGQATRLAEAHAKVSDLWKQVAEERQETILQLNEQLEPLMQGNEAILRAVEELQRQQANITRGGRR